MSRLPCDAHDKSVRRIKPARPPRRRSNPHLHRRRRRRARTGVLRTRSNANSSITHPYPFDQRRGRNKTLIPTVQETVTRHPFPTAFFMSLSTFPRPHTGLSPKYPSPLFLLFFISFKSLARRLWGYQTAYSTRTPCHRTKH